MIKTILYVANVDWYFKLHWIDRALASRSAGNRVLVACNFESDDIKEYLVSLGLECFDLKFSRGVANPINEWLLYRSIQKLIADVQPNIVHSITIKPNIYVGFAARKMNIPVIKSVTGRGVVYSSGINVYFLLRGIVNASYYLLARFSSGAFVFENYADYKYFKGIIDTPLHKAVVIPGAGIDLEEYLYTPTPQKGSVFKILFAARMLRSKGFDTVLEAVRILRERLFNEGVNIHLELKVAGIIDLDSAGAYSLEEIEERSQRYSVEWLGQVDDMYSLISASHIVVLPTRYPEGIPRILIEAGAVGRAIIASDVAGCKELLDEGDCGVLLKTSEPQELVNAVYKLIFDPDLMDTYSSKLRERIELKYANKFVIESFLNLYEELSLSV